MNEPIEVIKDVYRITPSRSNCYLLAGNDLTLIDTGMPGEADSIISAIAHIGRSVKDIGHILITHGHLDHTGSLGVLKKLSGARVVAGIQDVPYITGKKKTWTMGREGFGGKIFKTVLFFMETFKFKYVPVEVDMPCAGGELIDCAGGIQAVATPGHSPGSMSYYHRDKKLLFVGDSLSGTTGFNLPQRFGCADYHAALQSVEKLVQLDFVICLLGHGEPVMMDARTLMNNLLQKPS